MRKEPGIAAGLYQRNQYRGRGVGPVGPFNGVMQTGGMHMRQSTTFKSNLANGNYMGLAASLNTLNYATANNPTLPTIPASFRDRCSGTTDSRKTSSSPIRSSGAVNLMTNNFGNNYHSLAAQVTLRPVQGFSTQSTYTWSRNLGAGFLVPTCWQVPRTRWTGTRTLHCSRTRACTTSAPTARSCCRSDPTSCSSVTARESWRESSRIGR